MAWETHSGFDFKDANAVCHPEIAVNISKFSTNEIESLKTKVDFYIKHFSMTAKKDSEPVKLRIGFLSRLYSLLDREIVNRRSKLFI